VQECKSSIKLLLEIKNLNKKLNLGQTHNIEANNMLDVI